MRIFVNDTAVDVTPGADVRAALAAFDPVLAAKVANGAAYVTDARGIDLAPGAGLEAGSILRVVVSARRPVGEFDGDA